MRSSLGDVFQVGRLPEDLPDADRTLMLMGEPGLFLLRLTKQAMSSANLHSGAPLQEETEFLTRVFESGDWEKMMNRITPSSEEIKRILKENGMDESKLAAEEAEAESALESAREEAAEEMEAEGRRGGGG